MRKASYNIEKLLKVVPEAKGTVAVIGNGGLDLTIETIIKTVLENSEAMKQFAEEIKGKTLEQTAYNIWHFIKTNIKYVKDKPLTEEIRTPQRTLSDKIGDCDDYTIFAAAILKALNYEPFFYIVSFNGNENYGHIYAGVDEFIIDGVMPEYGKHPDNITKTMIVKMNGKKKVFNRSFQNIKNTKMLVEQLAGMPQNDITDLVDSEFNRLLGLGQLTENEIEDLNKIRVLKLLEGNAYRDYMTEIMPDIAGIDSDFNISFYNEDDMKEAEALLEEYNALQGLGDIDGLGKLFSKWRKNKDKRKARRKKFISKVKKVSKKITNVTKKVSLAPARGAILLLLKLNLFKWGSRLWLSYLPESKAKQYGLDLAAFRKLVAFRKSFEKFFEKAGGKKKAIFKAVSSRGAKAARKKYGINGLGSAVAAGGAVAAASPFLAWLGKAWSKVKEPFKKMFDKVKESKIAKAVIDKFKDAKKDVKQPDTVNEMPDNFSSERISEPEKETTDTSKLLLPLAAAGLLLMFIL